MRNMHYIWLSASILALGGVLALQSCQTLPKGATPVSDLEKEKYLGKWYEIARFDFKQEKNLNQVTAEYSLNDDNSIKVINKGFNFVKNEWESAEGKAKFVEGENIGRLKVSFFGPFYSPYNIISIDEDYKYALVFGKNTDYVWFLSREKDMPKQIKEKYLQLMRAANYDLDRLIWVDQKTSADGPATTN